MDWRFLFLILIPVFTAVPAQGAKKAIKADVEKFMQNYVGHVAKKDLAKLTVAESFKEVIEDDATDFEDCAKDSCKVVLREPVKIKEYDEDEEDAPEEDMFEVHMDVYKSGDLVARRSGCYMIMRKDNKFIMQEYQYECTE